MDSIGKQIELFNPLAYVSKRTYMLYAEVYLPWRKQEQALTQAPFLRRQKEIVEEEKARNIFSNDREGCFSDEGGEDE